MPARKIEPWKPTTNEIKGLTLHCIELMGSRVHVPVLRTNGALETQGWHVRGMKITPDEQSITLAKGNELKTFTPEQLASMCLEAAKKTGNPSGNPRIAFEFKYAHPALGAIVDIYLKRNESK